MTTKHTVGVPVRVPGLTLFLHMPVSGVRETLDSLYSKVERAKHPHEHTAALGAYLTLLERVLDTQIGHGK